jgi:hypothetical protein
MCTVQTPPWKLPLTFEFFHYLEVNDSSQDDEYIAYILTLSFPALTELG